MEYKNVAPEPNQSEQDLIASLSSYNPAAARYYKETGDLQGALDNFVGSDRFDVGSGSAGYSIGQALRKGDASEVDYMNLAMLGASTLGSLRGKGKSTSSNTLLGLPESKKPLQLSGRKKMLELSEGKKTLGLPESKKQLALPENPNFRTLNRPQTFNTEEPLFMKNDVIVRNGKRFVWDENQKRYKPFGKQLRNGGVI